MLRSHFARSSTLCWICETSDARSAEHAIKRSDLKALFGDRSGLYHHVPSRLNTRVQGLKSDRLKFGRSLCQQCNNDRTAAADKAWERLSRHLLSRGELRPGQTVRLSNVFPGKTHDGMLGVHLFFVKLLGCKAIEHNVNLEVGQLAQSILSGTANPYVYLAFTAMNGLPGLVAGHSDFLGSDGPAGPSFLVWIYHVGHVGVRVMFAMPGQRRPALVDAYHPSRHNKLLRIARG